MNRNLRAEIIRNFGTQITFARRIGKHESQVSKVIHGIDTLPEKDKKKWARILKTDVSTIFPEKVKK